MDTIFALSSGPPPAGIAVIRISGPRAGEALHSLAGDTLTPRRVSLRRLQDEHGQLLDQALVVWFPGPATVTGEDVVELHVHGGRAVVSAVSGVLERLNGVRQAQPGEFTRRAFANGRVDLAEAEGLADLLAAETELQRRSALAMADGAFSRQIALWRDDVLHAAAHVEALLDFGDEDDVATLPSDFAVGLTRLADKLREWLKRPRAEALREGFRVVIAGPPNAGKSTLLNALVERAAAITSPLAGTTRDLVECPVALEGIPFSFVDTAGLRDDSDDPIERIGIDRARAQLESADLVLWLGAEGAGPSEGWEIDAQCDRAEHRHKSSARHRVSALTGTGLDSLKADLISRARCALPLPGQPAINMRQAALLTEAETAVRCAVAEHDPLLVAEQLRITRVAFDRLVGRAGTEDMLDALFGRFCIGK